MCLSWKNGEYKDLLGSKVLRYFPTIDMPAFSVDTNKLSFGGTEKSKVLLVAQYKLFKRAYLSNAYKRLSITYK